MEDAYTARRAPRIVRMSGRVELEAHHGEPGGHYASLLCKRSGEAAGHPLR